MESLIEVAKGSSDIAVGISGFGSANVGIDRWQEMAELTGRTTYYLKYDAQRLPWGDDEDPPMAFTVYWEVMERWKRAREGALVAASYLAKWLIRWAKAGRKVLVVGFSLGGFTAWNAIRQVPDDLKGQIELIMISAAIGDRHDTWSGIDKLRSVTNLYSRKDAALSYVYPRGVGQDETPAAGLGPLVVGPLPNLRNVDIEDVIGWDHLMASRQLSRLMKIGLGCTWGLRPTPGVICSPVSLPSHLDRLSDDEISRLSRWTLVDPALWHLLGMSLSGDLVATHRLRLLDAWSLRDGRLLALFDAGQTVEVLNLSPFANDVASRSRMVLSGMLRHWISSSFSDPTARTRPSE